MHKHFSIVHYVCKMNSHKLRKYSSGGKVGRFSQNSLIFFLMTFFRVIRDIIIQKTNSFEFVVVAIYVTTTTF